MSAAKLLDQLDALHAAATTTEPWINDSHELYREMPGLPGITGPWIGETCDIDNLPGSEANAALIVAAVNALPQLTAALRATLNMAHAMDRFARAEAHDPTSGSGALTAAAADLREAITAVLSPADPMSAEPGMSQP